jgi:hypothetical protein
LVATLHASQHALAHESPLLVIAAVVQVLGLPTLNREFDEIVDHGATDQMPAQAEVSPYPEL